MDRLLARVFVWYGTHRRTQGWSRTPARFGLQYEDIAFRSAHRDQACLRGWLLPAQQPKALVVLCHGIDSNASCMLAKAAMLCRNGFTVLLFDFRASGRSDGRHVTLGLREADDVLGALAYIDRDPSLNHLKVLAVGDSMGGSAVIRAAKVSQHIRAVVAESTYATLSDALRQRLRPLGPLASRVAEHCHRISEQQFDMRIKDVAPEKDVAALSPRPLLLIHDSLDVLCPRAESDRLFAAAGHPKERWIVPYAPHTFAFMVAPREYERRVVGFLDHACQTDASDIRSMSSRKQESNHDSPTG